MTDHSAGNDAGALRAEFDAAFGRGATPTAAEVALLAIRIGGAPYAVRVLDAGGLVQAGPVVRVPSGRPEVLGIAGLRGEVLPVYGLGRMVLGVEDAPPGWLLLGRGAERIAFAFTTFDGHLLATRSQLNPATGGTAATRHVRELYTGAPPRPVLDLDSLVAAAMARTDRESP